MEKTDYKITEFHNSEFGSIRMIEDGGRLLFSGIDVAFALGYAKPRNAINVHCKGALKRGVLTSGGVQPKADYYDHFMITGECTNIRTTAKEIEFPERKFVKLLLNRGFLYRSPSGTLLPYAVEKNNDLFIVKDYFNNGHLGSQTLVTPKGKEFFKALCAEEE